MPVTKICLMGQRDTFIMFVHLKVMAHQPDRHLLKKDVRKGGKNEPGEPEGSRKTGGDHLGG